MHIDILKKLGFSDKSALVYLSLLQGGPTSVRKLAEQCGLNRGTTYDILNWLKDRGLVDFYRKDTKQYFVAEDPERLRTLVKEQEVELHDVEKRLDKVVPELGALYNRGGERPVARYYEREEIKEILQDVLETCVAKNEKSYRIYSAEGIREYLYEDFSTYSQERIAKGIRVQVIAIGKGGELRGLDERKWIPGDKPTPTYIIIYPGKTAYISINASGEPVGVVIENDGVYETQKMIFDELWATL